MPNHYTPALIPASLFLIRVDRLTAFAKLAVSAMTTTTTSETMNTRENYIQQTFTMLVALGKHTLDEAFDKACRMADKLEQTGVAEWINIPKQNKFAEQHRTYYNALHRIANDVSTLPVACKIAQQALKQ